MTTWRDYYRPIIAEVIKENKGKPEKEIRKALREEAPASPKNGGASWPYKIWCDEVNVQLGKKRPNKPKQVIDNNQTKLF